MSSEHIAVSTIVNCQKIWKIEINKNVLVRGLALSFHNCCIVFLRLLHFLLWKHSNIHCHLKDNSSLHICICGGLYACIKVLGTLRATTSASGLLGPMGLLDFGLGLHAFSAQPV